MADALDLSIFPAAIQGYATVGVSIVLGIVGVYGYYTKLRGDAPPVATPIADPTLKEIAMWLAKLLEAGVASAENTKLIAELMSEQKRQEEIDRAYQRGRDEALDRATALVAKNLKDHP